MFLYRKASRGLLNACDGSAFNTLRMPTAPAINAITTAKSGNCQKARAGTVTASGNWGARKIWMIAASPTAVPVQTLSSCRARGKPSGRPG